MNELELSLGLMLLAICSFLDPACGLRWPWQCADLPPF